MKRTFTLALAIGCFGAGQVLALEAVALPSDGAGSGSGANTYALANQLTAQSAAIGAQSAVLQQVNQAVTSLTEVVDNLTTQLNQLTQYTASTTCNGGTLSGSGSTMTCVGGTNTSSTSSSGPAGCGPYGTISGNHANGEVVLRYENHCAFTGATFPVTYQCLNGKWSRTEGACPDNSN